MYNKRGRAGEALIGSLHTMNITYATPQETLQGTPTVLPTSEPASPSFSYTVAASDLPTFDCCKPFSQYYTVLLYASGKNLDASTRTLCYRVKKNGSSIATATNISVTASQYWTLNIVNSNLANIAVGDVLEVYLWQVTASALNWDYQAFSVGLSRPQLDYRKERLLYNIKIITDGGHPTLTSGNPSVSNTVSPRFILTDYGDTYTIVPNSTTPFVIFGLKQAEYNLYRLHYGDNAVTISVVNHATDRPRYNTNYKFTQISWYPTALGV